MKIKSSKGEILTVPDGMEEAAFKAQAEGRLKEFADGLKERMKSGGMIKRKDGSYSRRGLWDNIRANRGSGRKPTKEMLKQEAKIRAEHGAGGTVFKGYVTEQPMSEPVPWHTSTIGEKMGKGGYTVKRSSARKGKTHVVIGPDGTKKYFGDSKLGQHPKDPARKKAFYARHAKNLKGNPYFRAFARATWADGGKLGQGIYDMGLMPYGDGGYTMGNMNPDGLISLPYGYGTPAYNERERFGFGGDLLKGVGDVGLYLADTATSAINQDIIGDKRYSDTGFGKAVKDVSHVSGAVTGALAPMAATAIGGPAAGMAVSAAQQASGQFVKPDQDRMESKSGQIGSMVGQAAGIGSMFYNPFGAASAASKAGPTMAGAASPLKDMMAQYGGLVRMADGGQTGMVPINIEGANFSQGSGPDAKKGELLVKNGKIVKNYVGRPPHPAEGQNPMGDDEAPEGLIVIPKNRTAEYLEAGLLKRKQMEVSLISQQQDREMKKAKRPSKKRGDGGYYSFGMGEMGMARGGMTYSDQLGGHDYAAKGGPIGNPETIDSMMGYGYKKGGWIQKATASIKRRGTEGVCTGAKFGSSSCPPGSRRYNLAKTFRKMAKARKHEYGGMTMYAEGGQLPESLLRTRMAASGASQEEINDYVAANYGYGGMTMYGEGGQLPENLLRARMRASGASPAEINSYVAARYEMGGPVNVDRSDIYESVRRRLQTGGPYDFTDFQGDLRMMNPGIDAQSAYTSPSAMLRAEADRKAMNERAGQMAAGYNLPRTQQDSTSVQIPYRMAESGQFRDDRNVYNYSDENTGPGTPNTMPNSSRMADWGSFRGDRNFYDYNDQGLYTGQNSTVRQGDKFVGPPTNPYNLPPATGGGQSYKSAPLPAYMYPPGQAVGAPQTPSYLTPGGGYGDIYNRAKAAADANPYVDPFHKGYNPPADWKGTPYRMGTPETGAEKIEWDCTTGTCKPIKTYRNLGYAMGAAEMAEGLLSKPDRYKRMGISRQAPELLNPREALADERRTAAGVKYGLRNTGANQRAAILSGAAQSAANRAGIYGKYDEANAQIRNAYKDKLVQDQLALMQQDQVAQMYDAQAKAARRNMIREGAGNIVGTASNVANMYAQNAYLKKLAAAGA